MLLYKLWKYIFKVVELEIYVEVVKILCVDKKEKDEAMYIFKYKKKKSLLSVKNVNLF